MLSLDVTDRNIRIIKGIETNGKIRISAAATLNLEESVIINGHCKDVPRLATLINQVLKTNRMSDKEAIISISSNLTIFKELHIPKAKEAEFNKMVKGEMQQTMGIDDQYGISYIIVGEVQDETGKPVQKVLATACPYEVVDCYRKVFAMLGVALKSVIVGCNCITKVLLSDNKIKSKMPLLAVQIDNNFLSLNLYEEGQLTFSRFASIDPSDYDNSDDYVFEAVNENIFRMLQFQRNRNPQKPIENVVFYGDTHEYVRLTNALEQMDISTGLISVPPQVHGYENLEFAVYANAIGAMFKRNKDTEHINLLETMEFGSMVAERIKSDKSFPILFGVSVGLTAVVMVGIYVVLAFQNTKILNDTKENQDFLRSAKVAESLAEHKSRTEMLEKIKGYQIKIENANNAYISKPLIESEVFKKTDDILVKYNKDGRIQSFLFEDGKVTLAYKVPGVEEPSQKAPSEIVKLLTELNYFKNVKYVGYQVAKETNSKTQKPETFVTYTLELSINGDKEGVLAKVYDAAAASTDKKDGETK